MDALKLDFPATSGNREPIRAVLQEVLPETGTVLEVASGSGQHVAYFAPLMPNLLWQPSDPEPAHRDSIRGWTHRLSNVREPLGLDVHSEHWPQADAVLAINLIHIAPWSATRALFAGAFRAGARLVYLYGAYRRGGQHTAPSNASFDASLRMRNAAWGVRDLEEVERVAGEQGFELERVVEMPVNNLSLVFRRAP